MPLSHPLLRPTSPVAPRFAPLATLATRFTLIEVLVVLVLLGLMLALVGPRVGMVPEGIEARRASTAVQDAFGAASHQALASGHDVQVRWVPEDSAWHVVPVAPSAGEAAAAMATSYADLNRFAVSRQLRVESTGERTLDAVAYDFYADGSASGAACTIRLGERQWSLAVDRLTGRPILGRSDL